MKNLKTKRFKNFVVKIKSSIIALLFGGLAQLASAFDWQSKGHGFESRILHINLCITEVFLFIIVSFYA